jgi:Ca2+-binding EF-hand superfamily protein
MYENKDIINYDIILYDEILPKIRKKIKKSKINSYKEYKLKIFNNIDYLDILELFSKFNELYGITLYNCLLLMKNEQFFSTEKFFSDNNLKNEFKCVDYDPTLKLALIRLNDFFQKNNDKIKVFKEFDLDRNGKLSYEEFITALNSFEDLNLNDNQKYKILNVIDINKDGKIDIKEFIKFINNIKNNINENGEINSNMPLINKKINNDENKNDSNSKVLNDKNQIKNNLNYNKNMLKQNNNVFLNYIIILQESLLKDDESLEKEFHLEDPMNKGIISINKFKNIMKNKLFNVKRVNIDKLINLANLNLREGENNKENEPNIIHYHNFLKNLSNYRYNKKEIDSSTNSQINLPKIN